MIRDSVLKTFGPPDSSTRATNDVFKLAREVSAKKIAPLPFFYFDCGTEDFLFNDNRELVNLFVELKIPHEYCQLPGIHAWTYWDAQLQEILRLAAKELRSQEPSLKSSGVQTTDSSRVWFGGLSKARLKLALSTPDPTDRMPIEPQ